MGQIRGLRTPIIELWRQQRQTLMEHGELPDDWDEIDPPRVRPGVWLRSLRMKRWDGAVLGQGGIVYEEAFEGWWTVDVYPQDGRMSPHRFKVGVDDVDWMQYTGEVNTRDLEGLRRRLAGCLAQPRNNYGSSFVGALAVLTAILESPERCDNTDRAVR
jgi:hypothetical protein